MGDGLRDPWARNVLTSAIPVRSLTPPPANVPPLNRLSPSAVPGNERIGGNSAEILERRTAASIRPAPEGCFHCGERCPTPAWTEQGHCFCCAGCQTVFSLLHETGLCQFYDFAASPGTRVPASSTADRWAFLRDPAVAARLLDYSDETRACVTLQVPSIHCLACVWLLENLFRLHPGIGESRVNFSRREVSVTFERAQLSLCELITLLASLGYAPELTYAKITPRQSRTGPRLRQRQWLQLGVAGFGFGNAMLLGLPGYWGLDSLSGPWFKALAGWLSLALALPVLIYSAADYWRAAWTSLRQRALLIEVPIALGLVALYGQSIYEVARGHEGYSDSLTGLIFFLLAGRMFQRKSFDRLVFDRDYKGFFPLSVLRKTATGEETVAISELAVGDRLLIRHGELVPADAQILSGEALVDYSFVTGEAHPVVRQVGESIYAGGRQMGGLLEVQTVKSVSESYLTSLWNQDAFRKKPGQKLETLTNRYSRRFTLGIIGIALATTAVWLLIDPAVALKAGVSVLIVACPCALALAAPLTLGTAHRWLASHAIFLRNAAVIEQLAPVDTVVFDKTGTLTATGAGAVVGNGPPLTPAEQQLVRSLARLSAHPLARWVTESLPESSPEPIRDFTEITGSGIRGTAAGHELHLGSAAWLNSLGAGPLRSAANSDSLSTCTRNPARLSGSEIHIAIDGVQRGCFLLEARLRPEVDRLMERLRGNCQLVLLSGDNAREEARFRALLGPDARIEFQQSPLDKLRIVRELQATGHQVVMVGDGLNDAGALKQADVGVAVVEHVGSFTPASDIIIAAAELPRLADMLTFARRSAHIVRAGFLLSGAYNVIGLSIAAAGRLSPLICAVLMPLSSVTVVLFAIAATRWTAWRTFRETPKTPTQPDSSTPRHEIGMPGRSSLAKGAAR